jgi:hypothetical protein
MTLDVHYWWSKKGYKGLWRRAGEVYDRCGSDNLEDDEEGLFLIEPFILLSIEIILLILRLYWNALPSDHVGPGSCFGLALILLIP